MSYRTAEARRAEQRRRYHNAKPATCHPARRNHAGGVCRECYRTGERAPRATCHPERHHCARGLCRECYQALPEVKAQAIRARRLKKYGLTESQYTAILEQQGWACGICGDPPTAIDHDHATGTVRGILCFYCNVGLGHFRDKVALLAEAIRYLSVAR